MPQSIGNPLLDRFRELQPDVDVLVLPPEPSLVDVPLATADDAEQAARSTRSSALRLLADVPDAGDPVVLERWDRLEPGVHRHRTRARVELPTDTAAVTAILAVLDVLGSDGWQARPVDAPTPWFVATGPVDAAVPTALTADVALQGRTLVVTIECRPLRLEEAPA